MKVIGITGGVGAGKSRILTILRQEYCAEVIQADEVAKALEEPGCEGLRLLADAFGIGILDETGRLDRGRFASLIFQDEAARQRVNEIIHPMTWKEICRQVSESRAPLVAVEAALFDESSRSLCEELWYIDADEETRIRRLMENRGYTRKRCLDMIAGQADRQFFLKLADVVIDNNGSLDAVRRQIEAQLGPAKETVTEGTGR